MLAMVAQLLGRRDKQNKLIQPESVTYPGKGTFELKDVLAEGFCFGKPRRPTPKPVTSHVLMLRRSSNSVGDFSVCHEDVEDVLPGEASEAVSRR